MVKNNDAETVEKYEFKQLLCTSDVLKEFFKHLSTCSIKSLSSKVHGFFSLYSVYQIDNLLDWEMFHN